MSWAPWKEFLLPGEPFPLGGQWVPAGTSETQPWLPLLVSQSGHVVETFRWWKHCSHIYECHMLCVCPSACPNRVVQRGLR